MKFFGWKRTSFVFAALATLEIAAAPAQNVQTVTVAPGQSVAINSNGEVQKQGAPQGQAQGKPAAQKQGQSKAQPKGQNAGQQFTQQQLDELLAPIALYPDALLAQVLAVSKNPQEVIDAGNWMGLEENKGLKDDALDKATKKAGFSPPMQALLHFPDVIDMMASKTDWTRQLGEAMNADEKSVLNAVQRLRDQAVDVGSLKSNDKQKVDVKQEGNTTVVVVEPANPQVIYVPQYDAQKVYAAPPQPTPTPEKEKEGVSEETAVMASLLSFGVGMAVGGAIWGSNSYCYPAWGYGGVYYGRAVYVAPAYRPAYRGAWGYSNAYRRSGYYANNQNRLTVNNNYYNRFQGNQNMRAEYQPSNYVRPTNPEGLAANREEFRNNAKANAANRNPGARPTPAGGTNRQVPSRDEAAAAAQGKANERRAAAGTSGGTTPSGDRLANAQAQRQSAGSSTGGASPSGSNAASRVPASDRPSTATPSGDRGFGQGQGSSGSGAFGGSGSSGRAAGASSSRGRASMRGGGGRRGR